MQAFGDILAKHFRLPVLTDNMPLMVKHRTAGGRQSLAMVMRDMGFRRGVEIGTRFGASAKLWCETIPGLELTCIDPYLAYHTRPSQEKQDKVYKEAQKTLQSYNVTFWREKSCDVADRLEEGSLDFLHIDGDHTFDAVVLDIVRYVPKVKKGGLILVHDYCHFCKAGVMEAINAYTHCHAIEPWHVTKELEPTAFWQRGAERL